MSGRWRVKHPDMRPLALTAGDAAHALGAVTYTWVPRERNKHADRLANEAMDAAARGGGGSRRNVTPARPAGTAQPAGPGAVKTGWGAPQGQPTITLLLRHGQTPLSAERRFAGVGDIELTETGMRQAKLAGERLAARGGVDVIVTSPLRRARQTAGEVAAATGAPVVAEEGFREADFGAWEGLTFAEARERWPEELAAWLADPATAPPDGESFTAVEARVKAALHRLLAGYGRQTVLVVSHVTPIKTLLTTALLAPLAALYRMHLDVGALSQIDWYADGPAVVRSLNDTAHLR
jgi:ribonuclease H / adenosylcobalamin/alpha-ribazole phosphatase